jgi:hypothetical protein
MRIASAVVIMIVAAAIVSTAQTPPPAAPAPTGACAFLTKEDAAAALGEAVTGPKAVSSPNGPSSCEYTGSGLHKVHLNVIPLTAASAGMYKAMCAQKNKDGLTGLGDVTCWYNDKHEELQVLKGLTFFSIEMHRSGDPTEAIKGVARKVYERVK